MIFLHIPKTGGLSLRSTLLAGIAPRPTFRILHPIDDVAKLAALPLEERRSLALVEGHMYYGVHEHIPGDSTYMTLLRDPVARLRSFHRYVSRERWHPFHGMIVPERLSLVDCIDRQMTVELDNYMTRSLTSLKFAHVPFGGVTREMFELAVSRLESMPLVGTTERLGDFHAELCRHMGWAVTAVPHLNRTEAEGGEIDGESERILEHNRFDVALWEQATRALEKRVDRATHPTVPG